MRHLCVLILLFLLACPAAPTQTREWESLFAAMQQMTGEGRYQDSERMSAQALTAAGADVPRIAATLYEAGLAQYHLGRYQQAEDSYSRGVGLLEGCGCEGLILSRLLDGLASVYSEKGVHWVDAEKMRRRALELSIAALGPENPDIGILLSNLAASLSARNRIPEARAAYEQALTLLEKAPVTYAQNIASALNNLAVLSFRVGSYEEAVPQFARAIALYENALGLEHPELVRPLLNLARTWLKLNRPAEAEVPAARAATLAGATLGSTHPVLVEAMTTYAVVLRKTGHKAEAREVDARVRALRAARNTVHVSDLLEEARR